MIKRVLSVGFASALSGCITVDHPQLPPGSFTGKLFVMWVDEGGSSGDGTFLFVPDPKNPLIFRRSDSSKPGAVIQPGLMYTDGGSIPKIAQVFKGLSPWGYAPAYMIHDWMFVAHHCIVDGDDDRRFDQVRDITFDDSAAILGEGIRGLAAQRQVQPNDLAADAITAAVDSSVARNLWDTRGACAGSRVRPEDVTAAEQAIPGSTRLAGRRSFRVPNGTPNVAPQRPARVITQITF